MFNRRFIRVLLGAPIVTALLMGCGAGQDSGSQSGPDTLTRRQKDSLISTLPIPQAGAVGKALDAADAAKARAERLDSIR